MEPSGLFCALTRRLAKTCITIEHALMSTTEPLTQHKEPEMNVTTKHITREAADARYRNLTDAELLAAIAVHDEVRENLAAAHRDGIISPMGAQAFAENGVYIAHAHMERIRRGIEL